MSLQKTLLNKGWHFRQTTFLTNSNASFFFLVSQFPTVAHTNLLYHKLIPDPYLDTNELDTLWLNDADWTYQTHSVSAVSFPNSSTSAVLIVDGLETIFSVYLSEQSMLESVNTYIAHRVDVKTLPRSQGEKESVLDLRFQDAPEYAKEEAEEGWL
jgi:beta-mannosidase